MPKFLPALLASLLLAACQSTPTTTAPVDERSTAPGTTAVPAASSSTPAASVTSLGINPLKDPNNILSKRNVYFDFDSFIVKEEYKALVTAHAKYLAGNKGAKMTIQGNADERGTHEYNLALGQKRADAVKKMMILLGATEAQVETVSFGKEKPRNPGHDESAWAENRRDDVVYQGE
ncbi:MAG: peptidoglycan-associated lipoprotein Pal [Betaproteobacteria bacterium]|nr:peptidoglycan-associated lipoprotein Pal [Betaproteobacteria bacterium]